MTLQAKGLWSRAILLTVTLGLCAGLLHSHPVNVGRAGPATAVTIDHAGHGHSHGPADHSLASAHCSYCLELGGKLYFTAPAPDPLLVVTDTGDFTDRTATLSSAAVQGLFRPPIATA